MEMHIEKLSDTEYYWVLLRNNKPVAISADIYTTSKGARRAFKRIFGK